MAASRSSEAALEAIVRRDRTVVVAALGLLTVVAWLYLLHLGSTMPTHETSSMPGMGAMSATTMATMHPWSWVDVGALIVMWAVMMVGMMTPAATPMIVMFATVHRGRAQAGHAAVPTAVFVLGYLAIWVAFSVVAALAQSWLHARALLSPTMAATTPVLAGSLLIAAGVYQWTPLKRACLRACRSPLSFLMSGWREGRLGAFRMGVSHGGYCLGCCWALMALLFVAGVMNLAWIAVLAVAVLIEKVVPYGDLIGRLAGGVLLVAGVVIIAGLGFRS